MPARWRDAVWEDLGRDSLEREKAVLWAAGYCDGEAWVGFRSPSSPVIEIKCVAPFPLIRLQCLFGGTISAHGYKMRGKHNPRDGVLFRWYVCGDNARSAAAEMYQTGVLVNKTAQMRAAAFCAEYAGTSLGDTLLAEANDERNRRYDDGGYPRW